MEGGERKKERGKGKAGRKEDEEEGKEGRNGVAGWVLFCLHLWEGSLSACLRRELVSLSRPSTQGRSLHMWENAPQEQPNTDLSQQPCAVLGLGPSSFLGGHTGVESGATAHNHDPRVGSPPVEPLAGAMPYRRSFRVIWYQG